MTTAELTNAARRYVMAVGFDDCPRCKGHGVLMADRFVGAGTMRSTISCPECIARAEQIVQRDQ